MKREENVGVVGKYYKQDKVIIAVRLELATVEVAKLYVG